MVIYGLGSRIFDQTKTSIAPNFQCICTAFLFWKISSYKSQITRYASWFPCSPQLMSSARRGHAKPYRCLQKSKPEFVLKSKYFQLKHKLFHCTFRVNDNWKSGWLRLWRRSYWCQNCWSASLLWSVERTWNQRCWSASEAKLHPGCRMMRCFRQWCLVGSSPVFWSWVELTVTSSNSQVIQQVAPMIRIGSKIVQNNHCYVSLLVKLSGAPSTTLFLSQVSFPWGA